MSTVAEQQRIAAVQRPPAGDNAVRRRQHDSSPLPSRRCALAEFERRHARHRPHLPSANYTKVFSDRRTYTVLIDTFAFAFVALAVALGIGIPIAWIAERRLRAKTLLFTLMAVGLLIPGFAVAMGWLFLLHPRIGLINQLFRASDSVAVLDHDDLRDGLGSGAQFAPLAFIMTAAVFRSMDPSMEEAAEVQGARPLRVLRAITVRLAWPGSRRPRSMCS